MDEKTKLMIRAGKDKPPNGAVYEEIGIISATDIDAIANGGDVTVFKPGSQWSNTDSWMNRDEIHLDVAHYVKHLTYLASQHGTNTHDYMSEMCRLFDARKQKHPRFWEDRPNMVIDIANACLHQTEERMIGKDGITEIITDSLKECEFITAGIPDKDENYIEDVYDFDDFVKGMGYETGDEFTYYRFTPARGRTPATYDLTKPIYGKKAYNRPAVINLQTWIAFFDRFYMFKDSEWEEDMEWIMELLYSKRIQKGTMARINKKAKSILNDAKTNEEKHELNKRLKMAKCFKLTGSKLDDIKALLIHDLLHEHGVPILSRGFNGKLYENRNKAGPIYTKTGVTGTNKLWRVAYSPSKQFIEIKELSNRVEVHTDFENDVWRNVAVEDDEYQKLTPKQRMNGDYVRRNYSITRIQQKGSIANLSPRWDGKLDSILNPMKTRMWGIEQETLASAWSKRKELAKHHLKFKGTQLAPYNVRARIPELVYIQTTVRKYDDPFAFDEVKGKFLHCNLNRDFKVGHTVVARYKNRTGMYEKEAWVNHYQVQSDDDWDGSPKPSITNQYGGPLGEASTQVSKKLEPKKKRAKAIRQQKPVVTKKADRTTFSGDISGDMVLEEMARMRTAESDNDSSLDEE
jgi:hypothetical protein